jgi:hypothetical protein
MVKVFTHYQGQLGQSIRTLFTGGSVGQTVGLGPVDGFGVVDGLIVTVGRGGVAVGVGVQFVTDLYVAVRLSVPE